MITWCYHSLVMAKSIPMQPLFKMQLLKPSALLKPWPRQSVQLFKPIPTRSELPGQTTSATPQIVCGCLMWHPCFAKRSKWCPSPAPAHSKSHNISRIYWFTIGLPLVYPDYFWGVQHVSTCFCWCTQHLGLTKAGTLWERAQATTSLSWSPYLRNAKTWGRLPSGKLT
jgi:hypothetical protein